LRQVLTNLLGNAIKFTAVGEVVLRVSSTPAGEEHALLRFEIRDTGIGISEDARQRLFRPFTQADGSIARRFGGTGLGLAICKRLAALMGGEIGVESTPGSATFWFTVRCEKQLVPLPQPRRDPAALANLRVLIVDDNLTNRQLLEHQVTGWQMRNGCADSGQRALEILGAEAAAGRPYDLALLDFHMPDMDGLTFLDARPPGAPPVVMMSAYGTVDTALEAMRRGAYDYVSKPFKADEIVLTLRKLQEREQLAAEGSRLAVENARLAERTGEPVEGFVGRSPGVIELLRVLARAAVHESSVLLTGESGTGKELLARALHRLSPRKDGPWVAVNCAAIPEPLLESELFGHRRGSFTGAVRDHAGLFEQADGGTLFLDEIGELPVALQAKLLRTLQEGTIRRLGGSGDVSVNVRIVAATAGSLVPPRFREDLYYRVAVLHLQIPPLRERADDIPLLVDYLLTALCARMRLPRPRVSDAAMRLLVSHRWPGNVRQLENVLERALLVSDADVLDVAAIPGELRTPGGADVAGDSLSIPARTAALERALIQEALRLNDGNKAGAARMLEISYKALLYKVRDYGLEGG